MKKLPIGIQSFEKIINSGCVYVDKTALILRLITESANCFLSRPRRFGKSLLLSTLKTIFSGDKKLFKGCSIYSSQYEWQKYPIIHLDFTQFPTKDTQDLKNALKRHLEDIAVSYNKKIKIPSLQYGLADLVKKLSRGSKVVVLVDEYDKPLIDNLGRLDVAEANRDLLKDFFGTLKGLDSYLRFVFVTGVSKFSQVSLFSGFNNLEDLTMSPDYATLLGYTEKEILQFFEDHIKKIAVGKSKTRILEEMKGWYNGYRFSWGAQAVYNPHSTLSFLKIGRLQSFWFRTGTPSFLIEQMRKVPRSTVSLSGAVANENELMDIRSLKAINLKALMWQTGYLTIQAYDPATALYQLDFPNREVRKAFFESLIQEFAELESSAVDLVAIESKQELEKCNLVPFFLTINAFFAKIPYSLFKKGDEGTYHAIFLSLLEAMGMKVRAEEQTNVGRIDLVLELEKIVYIFEFKIDKKPKQALQQIEVKKYKEKYLTHKKEIATVGVTFSSKTRNISDWKAVIYAASGRKKAVLQQRKKR